MYINSYCFIHFYLMLSRIELEVHESCDGYFIKLFTLQLLFFTL